MPYRKPFTVRHQLDTLPSVAVGRVPADPGRYDHDPGLSGSAARAASEAILGRVLVEQEAASRQLQAELSELLAGVRHSAIFERRLYVLARDAAVLDGVQLVRLVRACLPKSAWAPRFAAKRALRRLHRTAARECDDAGYRHFAAAHLARGVLLEPATLLRRRSVGILSRCLFTTNGRNRRLLNQAASVFRLFNAKGVRSYVFGSLAISLNAGRFVKHHGDIDLVFPTEADTNRAVALLVDELEYRIVRHQEWTGLTGERCFHFALNGPSGIPLELSYLPENPVVSQRVVTVHGVAVRTADLRGLRAIYALFLVRKAATSHDLEKQSKKSAIRTIDRLLGTRAM